MIWNEWFVLIETYWNVNLVRGFESYPANFVLIETYWNVNFEVVQSDQPVNRINRNILECKYDRYTLETQYRESINRNILECKFLSGS